MIECKEAILDSELDLVRDFLAKQDLVLDKDIDLTLYLEENGNIVGTISKYKYIIKCVAIDPNYQGEALTGLLVNKIVEKMSEENIFSYQVFTKLRYSAIFESLGFKVIASSTDSVMLEKGVDNINKTIQDMRSLIKNNLGEINEFSNVACVVMNANPFTLGHQYLIEEMRKNHDYVLIFLVSEDRSVFSYEEREAMTFLCTSRYDNVLIIPSSKYMVSSLTFPSYFIHDLEERTENAAELDATIFKVYFMRKLFIKKRYVGSETKDYMILYNDVLKDILKDDLVIVDRCSINNNVVSAETVRSLLEQGSLDEALLYVPNEEKTILSLIAMKKYGIK